MPLQCPRCEFVQTYGNYTCINCGEPLYSAKQLFLAERSYPETALSQSENNYLTETVSSPKPFLPEASSDRRLFANLPSFLMGILCCALLGTALFLAYLVQQTENLSVMSSSMNAAAPSRHSPADTPPVPGAALPAASAPPPAFILPRPAAKPAAASAGRPLVVSLSSTLDGRRGTVGSPVTLTALAPNRNAALTLFYQRERGQKTTLSFAQGSLFSTTWIPAAPGRYDFRALALDGAQSAVSRPIAIIINPLQSTKIAALSQGNRTTQTVSASAIPRKIGSQVAAAKRFHVAAARFFVPRSAAVLAAALRVRGFHAVARHLPDDGGKKVYVVETGDYAHETDSRKAVMTLLRAGYPAYSYQAP